MGNNERQVDREALEDRDTMVALDKMKSSNTANQDGDQQKGEASEGYMNSNGMQSETDDSHTNNEEGPNDIQSQGDHLEGKTNLTQANLPKPLYNLTENNEKPMDESESKIDSQMTEHMKTMVASDQIECTTKIKQDVTQENEEPLEDRKTMVALECTPSISQDDDHQKREALEGYVKLHEMQYESNSRHTDNVEEPNDSHNQKKSCGKRK